MQLAHNILSFLTKKTTPSQSWEWFFDCVFDTIDRQLNGVALLFYFIHNL